MLASWLKNDPSLVTVVRFLGTTPQCSTIETALHSICQQLSYNLEV